VRWLSVFLKAASTMIFFFSWKCPGPRIEPAAAGCKASELLVYYVATGGYVQLESAARRPNFKSRSKFRARKIFELAFKKVCPSKNFIGLNKFNSEPQ